MAKYSILSNQLPKISKYSLDRERQGTKYFRYTETIEVSVDDLVLSENDPRAEIIDYAHVDDILVNLNEAGHDEDAELPAVTINANNTYDVIDHHHMISALKLRRQKKWYVDVYEYTGSYGEKHKFVAATELGFQINNSHNPVKATTIASVVAGGLKKIKEVGYIYEPGTPVDDPHIRMWLKTIKANERFSPGKLTLISNQILNPSKLDGKKIRNLSTDESRELILKKSLGLYDSGPLANKRYGYVVCTDNPKADGPKGYNQMINSMDDDLTPVFITYSKKDDAGSIVKNHKAYCDKIYETHRKHIRSISKLYPISLEVLPKEEFFTKLQIFAFGQIDGEYTESDFVSRPLF